MAHLRAARSGIAALLILTLFLGTTVYAEEFESEQFGFRFKVPDGFHERADGMPNTIKLFAEDEATANGYLIAIYIQSLGELVLPSVDIDPARLPQREGLRLSLEKRHWQEIDLQVVRQDGIIGNRSVVGYVIQFPLQDEGIQIRVQGPKDREQDVLNTFDQALRGFVNLKPYIVSSEPIGPGKATRAVYSFLLKFVPACVSVALMALLLVLIRRSQTKSTGAQKIV
jgi:hypothetical protein